MRKIHCRQLSFKIKNIMICMHLPQENEDDLEHIVASNENFIDPL